MTQLMMQYLSPLLIVAFGIVLSLLLIAWRRSQKLILHFTLAIFVCALLSSISLVLNTTDAVQITALIKGNNYAYIAFILILLVSMVVGFLSSSWLRHPVEVHDEFFVLLQLVVLSATASSFMLLGIAFVYSQSGSLSFSVDAFSIAVNGQLYFVGFLLFIVGVAFKLSLAPFHFWTPDVYQGAPTAVTLLLATVSKVAMFVVLMKYWFSQSSLLADSASNFHTLVSILAVLSMLTGNFLALKQQNIKRLLAYSSIAHMGYLLMVLLVVFPQSVHLAWQSALFYLIAYVIATISLFIALQLSEGKNANTTLDGEQAISDWQGMFWHNRVLALLIIVAILSLAGIPLTAGFIGKFYVLNTAVQAQQWWLITTLIVGSGIGLFYYLKIIFTLFDGVNQEQSMYLTNAVVPTKLSPVVNLSVILIILAGVILGVYPDIVSQMF